MNRSPDIAGTVWECISRLRVSVRPCARMRAVALHPVGESSERSFVEDRSEHGRLDTLVLGPIDVGVRCHPRIISAPVVRGCQQALRVHDHQSDVPVFDRKVSPSEPGGNRADDRCEVLPGVVDVHGDFVVVEYPSTQ